VRPLPNEFPVYYAGYINLIKGENIIKVLEDQIQTTQEFLKSISEEDSLYYYAEGKWTIKQVVGHVTDTERIMAYRALCIARKEKQSLPGFEENDYALAGKFNSRKIFDLVDELRVVRKANLPLLKSFDEEMIAERGTANNKEITVLALMYIIAGHQEHHLKILRERYLERLKG